MRAQPQHRDVPMSRRSHVATLKSYDMQPTLVNVGTFQCFDITGTHPTRIF